MKESSSMLPDKHKNVDEQPGRILMDTSCSVTGTVPIILNKTSWASLFTLKPHNAVEFSPCLFDLKAINGINIPHVEVIEAGSEFWHHQLVGFSLKETPPFLVVKYNLMKS